jgi:hypothetical protein
VLSLATSGRRKKRLGLILIYSGLRADRLSAHVSKVPETRSPEPFRGASPERAHCKREKKGQSKSV